MTACRAAPLRGATGLVLPLAAGLAALVAARPAAPQERLRPPPFVTCDRNRLTSFTGQVSALVREPQSTLLTVETDWDTTESFTIRGRDPLPHFFLDGRPFLVTDWHALIAGGRLRAGMRADVWVCEDEPEPKVDWHPRSGTRSVPQFKT